MRKIIGYIMLVGLSINLSAQLNKTYFKKLQTEQVESSDIVEWTQIGPGMAGYCEEFWCHPTDDNVMFMSPDMYNSYGTWDNGKSWQTIKDYDGSGVDMRRVQSIVFSHQNADFGYAVDVRGHLYNTTDKGRNWARDLSFIGKGKYSEIAVDPSNDKNWYIGAGSFWNVKSNHRSKDNTLGYVYKYAAYGHILKSTDKGKTWKKINKGLPATLDVGRIIVDPTNSKNIVLASNSGVYRSKDQGESWRLSGKGLPHNLPRDMAYYYNKKEKEFILYLVEQTNFEAEGESIKSTGGVFKSTDHGASWVSISGNLAIDLSSVTSYGARQKYWKSVGFWLGMDAQKVKEKYPELPKSVYSVYNRLVVNPNNKDEIYLSHNTKHDKAFLPGDVWKTNNGGKTWIATARTGKYWINNKDKAYWESRNNPTKINTMFAHLQPEMERREETFGNRFLQINSKGEVFVCLEQQVMRSNNKGETWEQIDDNETEPGSGNWVGRGGSNLPGRFILTETGVKDRYLFCSGEHGLWQSAPLGKYPDKKAVALKQMEGQLHHRGATSIASVAVHPKDPNTIYIIMFRQDHRGQFRRSTDGGKTWKNLSYPLEHKSNQSMAHIFQYSLTIDYENPSNIYFVVISNPIAEVSGQRIPKGFTDFGVYRSTDGGMSWTIENKGMPEGASVRRLKIDPSKPSVLYTALNQGKGDVSGGLYKSINNAESWSKMNIPSQIKSVNNVFIDRNTKYIYISCGRSKGSKEEGGVWRSKDDCKSWEKIFDLPYIWQTETSPVNPDIITVNAAMPKEKDGVAKNPGAYVSFDAGKTWNKININLGQPNTIVDLKPDPYRKDIFWCALKGSGWAIGYLKGTNKAWSEK